QAFAGAPDYYGGDFRQEIQSGNLRNEDLIHRLHEIISQNHHALGYDPARKQLFGRIYLNQSGKDWAVTDVYCEKEYRNSDFPRLGLGPGVYPKDGTILNTEHTWPQSRFTGRFSRDLQKSDLHHLFPTDSEMNSHRSALHFGDVAETVENLKCSESRLGHAQSGEIVFEPPKAHRGNVARAIFYFATRYEMKINDQEESSLKKWNHDDPVDAFEMERNDEIQDLQGNRNPYIDMPELLDQIRDF
ncbi:MAG: nuclease, partial [Bdellovibrio sp. CG10_big_fil_rev_8_21_14_0_10_47_8]